jgi:hypothetical protein
MLSNEIEVANKEVAVQSGIEAKADGRYVIVRTESAGAFAGELVNKVGPEVELRNARRLWYWDGAASLSQLAMEGVSKPENCKFPCETGTELLYNWNEIIGTTEAARTSIKNVPVWSK